MIYSSIDGEQLVHKRDVLVLYEKLADCEFRSSAISTLMDEAFCREMLRIKNLTPACSGEHTPALHYAGKCGLWSGRLAGYKPPEPADPLCDPIRCGELKSHHGLAVGESGHSRRS